MTIPVLTYDPAEDGRRSYDLAIKTKHDRGDDYYLLPARDHVPVTRSPSPWLFRITMACAVFWAAVVGAFWWWV